MRSRWTNQDLINAYNETGSVWQAGKKLGLAGQTVHERLKQIGFEMSARQWTPEELKELEELAQQMTISEIASRLGRPYNGVAIKISRLGLGNRYGNNLSKKPKRTKNYHKANIIEYIKELDENGMKLTQYSRHKGLSVEMLTQAIQAQNYDWWLAYAERNAAKPKTKCPYCETEFWPQSGKQIFCNRKCANDSRVDHSYFGGKRRTTIGLAERTCQLCGRKDIKGLSSHHMIGKENDPENDMLIALCPGCHNLVTQLGGRVFTGTPEIWEGLIQLALIRKHGANKDFYGVNVYVDIEYLTAEDVEDTL